MFTDSHCHLNFPELVSQLPAIRQAMAEAQVTRALCICTTLEEFDGVHALAMAHDNFWSTVGVHPDNEGIAEPSVQDLLDRAALPRVVAIGEIGYDEMTPAEEFAYQAQLKMAVDYDMLVMVHSPHRDKKRGVLRSMDVAREMGVPMHKLIIDHNNEETVRDVLDYGAWAAFTIYPNTKMGSARMVEIVREYGPERIIVDSSADWGVSDPLSVPKTAKLMLERGIDPAAVELTTWSNAIAAYAQSGQIDVDALMQTPVIDQRQSYSDNSVLRGQKPRVDEPVPN